MQANDHTVFTVDSAMTRDRKASAPRGAARARAWLAALMASAALSACGGGVSLGFGFGDGYDSAEPQVSIASPQQAVAAGGTVRLVAAAADDNGIYQVAFYRLDGEVAVLLGSVATAPYEWTTVVPNDGRAVFSVFAEATDNTGRRGDSQVLSFALR